MTRSVRDGDHDRRLVDNFSFSFRACRIYTLVGPSGAGKSSLLRLLNRLDEPTGGEVRYQGRDSRQYDPCQLRRRIGYLFQTPHLFPATPRDNLLYAHPDLTDNELKQLLAQVSLPVDILDRDAEKLSVGEKQRVALARLLATHPDVILLDEPTSALDPANAESIEQLVKSIVGSCGVTAIMVTHHPEQALRMGGETILMVTGRLVESGPCEKVIKDPQTEEGRLYRRKLLT